MKSFRTGAACAILFALSACSTADMGRSSDSAYSSTGSQSDRSGQTSAQASGQSGSQVAQSSETGQGSSLNTQASGAAGGGLAGQTASSGWSAPPDANAVVTAVDAVPRSSSDVGSGSMAGAAVGGTGTGSDRVYRISIRLDDGSTRTITQESAPPFRPGDRVKVGNEGMIDQQQQR